MTGGVSVALSDGGGLHLHTSLNRGEQNTRGGNACIEVAGGNGLNDVGSVAEHSLGDRSAGAGKVSSGDSKKQRGLGQARL